MKKRLKVVLDCDEVLFECNRPAIDRLNRELGTGYVLTDIDRWGSISPELDRRFAYFTDPEFVKTQPLKKGAGPFVRQLSRYADITFTSSVPENCAEARLDALTQAFAWMRPIPAVFDKSRCGEPDFFLDDCPMDLELCQAKHKVLFKRPWNRNSPFPAVATYREFLEIVREEC